QNPQQVRFAGQQQTPSADEFNTALFKLLDTNNDGKLSKEELAAAPTALLKRDENDDEVITVQELLPGVGRNNGVLVAPYGRNSAPQPVPSPFVMLGPRESGMALARRLRERYGGHATKLTR